MSVRDKNQNEEREARIKEVMDRARRIRDRARLEKEKPAKRGRRSTAKKRPAS
jgi:hypothetical protein